MQDRTASDEPSELPRAGWRSWLVAVLVAVCYTVAYLDRQVISLLIKPIQAALNITDTEFGLLQGVSFSLFYVAAALPLAWLADRTRRSRVMSGCVAFWSVMTMCCGLAGSFGQLMAARIGVAVGEAGLTPAALATLSDRFNRRQLATATSLFMLAPFLGGGLALGAGGAVYVWAQHLEPDAILVLAGFSDWQIVFLIIGAAGLVPAFLLLLIADRPARGAAKKGASVSEVFALFRREWKIYMLFQFAMALIMVVLAGYVTWLPAAIMRSKGIDEAQVGALFGPIYLICGATGTLSAGVLVMMRAGDDPVRTVMRYMLLMLALLWPLAAFGLMTSSLTAELAMMGAALFMISSVTSLSSLPFQYITPRHLRAQAIAIMAMVAALFGTGFGPVLAGILSDHLQGVQHPLSVSLSVIGGLCVPMVMALIMISLREHGRRRLDLGLLEQSPAGHAAGASDTPAHAA
ncbi:MFS transporter [Sphingomonas sp. ID0503]|uniref:MFS transporter n=1 Tax=Sphingomonas sp. ID0503 TaxID=3399691 RepID=UPI003AFA108B